MAIRDLPGGMGASISGQNLTPVLGHEIRRVENLHIALWLLKDISWVSDWKWFGLAVAVPTLAVATQLTWRTRAIRSELVHNLAVCCWICANIVWMIGEFYFDDGTRPFAKLFFYAGLSLLAVYYGREAFLRMTGKPQLERT